MDVLESESVQPTEVHLKHERVQRNCSWEKEKKEKEEEEEGEKESKLPRISRKPLVTSKQTLCLG